MARPEFTGRFEETEGDIKQRLVDRIPDNWRKEPGDFIHDAVAPTPLEVKQLQINQDYILKNAYAQYAEGEYMDLKLAEVGLTRMQATAAKRNLSIVADAGVVIPAGHTATVVILDEGGNPLEYAVDSTITFGASGTKEVPITCSTLGAIGNIPEGSEFILLPPIPGVRSITDGGSTFAGSDQESDTSAWERYEFKVNNPDTGGNKNDYVRWTQEVVGVTKSRCIPRWNGNGTVKLSLVGADYGPAGQTVVDEVQNYLDPKLNKAVEAEGMVLYGFGAFIDQGQVDDSGYSVKLAYDSQGEGYIMDQTVKDHLETENHFKARFKVKADDLTGTTALLKLEVRKLGTTTPLKQTRDGVEEASITVTATDLTTNFDYVEVPFYWDGVENVELEVRRLSTDTITTVWVDLVNFESIYGQALGEGKAPAGARILAAAADNLPINIEAVVTFTTGSDPAQVKATFEASVNDYLKSIVFTDSPVVYAKIGSSLISTEGISNYSNLLVNGGTDDVVVGNTYVATLGQVNI